MLPAPEARLAASRDASRPQGPDLERAARARSARPAEDRPAARRAARAVGLGRLGGDLPGARRAVRAWTSSTSTTPIRPRGARAALRRGTRDTTTRFPIRFLADGRLLVGVADPTDVGACDELRDKLGDGQPGRRRPERAAPSARPRVLRLVLHPGNVVPARGVDLGSLQPPRVVDVERLPLGEDVERRLARLAVAVARSPSSRRTAGAPPRRSCPALT